jgi:Na+/H+-dicarboxylate symporter/ABC-type amino acid transport substrate-binding protein
MKKLSLSAKVLIGVLLGIAVGVFFGEHVAWLSILGDIFIGLLQMTVLPYIMISLIVNIGRLSMESAKRLIKYGLIFLGLLLGLGLIGLFILPFSFPEWGSGSFYSSDFVQTAEKFDFVKLYIPSNPFSSMSNNVVPAVVLFSIFIGLGLMKLPNKEVLLQPLDVMNKALNQVNKMIVKITPLGVFGIAGGIVSKLSWPDLSRLQGYLLVYFAAVIIMTFVVLPYVISIFTPYSAKDVFRITRSTLITIFATGKIIVVYPQLIEDIKKIISEKGGTEAAQNEVDIMMPLAYPFPNLGTFMIFIFVPFAAWYTGHTLSFSDYPLFLSSTLLSSFVAPITGLPFTLDILDIPKETINLFMISTVITDRIRVVLGAFHLITLTLLSISASRGLLKIKKKKLINASITVVVTFFLAVTAMNWILAKNMERIPTNVEILNHFKLISPQQPYKILKESGPNPALKWRGENVLGRIKRRGKIRIGFYEDAIPFSFYNADSQLVGLGIDLAHQLAKDLEVSIEFVPIRRGRLIDGVKKDYYDIVMSDIFLSTKYAQEILFSKPYLTISLALVTPKENDDLNTFESATKLDSFTIGYFERNEVAEEYASFFGNAKIHPITSLDEFFNGVTKDSVKIDAYLTSAERASILTIIHPGYKVVNPLPYHIQNALVFPLAQSNVWKRYIDNWIEYRTKDGTINRVYEQWILGHEYKKRERPWSVWDDIIMPMFANENK